MEPNRRTWTTRWSDWAAVSGLLGLVLLCSVYAWYNREIATVPPPPLHFFPQPANDPVSTRIDLQGSSNAGITTNALSWTIAGAGVTPTAPDAIGGVYLAPPTATPTPDAPMAAIFSLLANLPPSCSVGQSPVILRQATERVVGTPVCEATI